MLVPLKFPPGSYRNGTEADAAGRWGATNMIRWVDGVIRPVKGSRQKATGLSGSARAMLCWMDEAGGRWGAVGTHTHLYAMTQSGALHDITPASFVSGRADAAAQGGFGSGKFGAGAFGTPRADNGTVQSATVWSLATWGQNLVGVCPSDGRLVEWSRDTAVAAQVVSGAPTDLTALAPAEKGFLFVLKGRRVTWPDQGVLTTWTPSATNQAGDVDLQTQGTLLGGVYLRGGTLLFTTTDVHLARWTGGNAIFSFTRIANDCGPAGAGAVVEKDGQAVWMGREGFWIGDTSGARQMPSDVSDYVYSDFNRTQASKVSGFHNADFGEVWWLYPSSGSTENDQAVVWCYREGWWATHELARTCAAPRGVFGYPLMVTPQGAIHEHEVGFTYDVEPYAQSGPVSLNGQMVMVRELIPDEKTSGDVAVTFKHRPYPNGDESSVSVTLSARTDVPHFIARQVALRIAPERLTDWRWGTPLLDVKEMSRR